jgi:UDP-N-acetylmuramate--alanine ligase
MESKIKFNKGEIMKKVHIIGIGGIAMSAIAQYFIELGYEVTGSDIKENELVTRLKGTGVQISIGHKADNISQKLDKVIYSDAIPEDNIELKQAAREGIETLNRSEALAWLTRDKRVISAAGTHGKTTTSSLIAQLLTGGGLAPGFIIGGILNNFDSNFTVGAGDYFVLEGDEYGKSFLKYPSDIGVVTNVEFDHPDIYDDLAEVITTYQTYIEGLTDCLITNEQVLEKLELTPAEIEAEVITVGVNNDDAQYNAVEIESEELTSYFTLEYQGEKIDTFKLAALGEYNIKHALEAIAVARYCGIPFASLKEALADWQGVKRRFEVLYRDQERIVITDYAHHPQEVEVVVSNLEQIKTDKDKIVIFQPHQYIRTKSLLTGYEDIEAKGIDQFIVYKIYKVREKVEVDELERLSKEVSKIISSRQMNYFNKWDKLAEKLNNYDRSHSAIYLFLGAGNIDQFARNWVTNNSTDWREE